MKTEETKICSGSKLLLADKKPSTLVDNSNKSLIAITGYNILSTAIATHHQRRHRRA
jgi:hypothetical protein